ncbi:hypothetical protein AB0M95_40665, partial [Sphaerisporangium sp. NPDC051017]|uniref:hypothetical protein n=1 Tax=Sphaerisporangium sp. NPDC051017 TaxID=3154636 RepID=UPI00341B1B67
MLLVEHGLQLKVVAADVLGQPGGRKDFAVIRIDRAVSSGGSKFGEHLDEHFGWRSVPKYTPRTRI